jgi:hypothetical protein
MQSAAFSRSPRLARLLRYLCEKSFAGEADTIREYSIAVEVLERPAEFDSSEDAIARVEVHRLRKKLREYYATEGAAAKVVITIPSGRYAPEFVPREIASPANGSEGGTAVREESSVVTETELAGPAADEQTTGTTPVPAPVASTVNARAPGRNVVLLSAAGVLSVIAIVALLYFGQDGSTVGQSADSGVPAPPRGDVIRIVCGQTTPYTDRLGRTWAADQYYAGGTIGPRTDAFISRLPDPRLVQSARVGEFRYDIPLKPGTYQLHLYFAETNFGPGAPGGGGENSRRFHVDANGVRLLERFDVLADAGGPFIGNVRVFRNITPADDGALHLSFTPVNDQPMLSAIEIYPAHPNRLNPIRIVAQETFFTDSSGNLWHPDTYYSGGQISRHDVQVTGHPEPGLFTRERWGHFTYAIPLDVGVYRLSLYLAESYWGRQPAGGGEGSRVYDVFCNGAALLRNLDLFKETGGVGRPVVKTFRGLTPNAQGKLVLTFVPWRDYGSVYAIEVIDETPPSRLSRGK